MISAGWASAGERQRVNGTGPAVANTAGPEGVRKRSGRRALAYLVPVPVPAPVEVLLLLEVELVQPMEPTQTNAARRSIAISFFTVKPSFQQCPFSSN